MNGWLITLDVSRVQAQMDADRRERSAQAPVIAPSVAKALPSGTNMRTAGEAGLSTGGCC